MNKKKLQLNTEINKILPILWMWVIDEKNYLWHSKNSTSIENIKNNILAWFSSDGQVEFIKQTETMLHYKENIGIKIKEQICYLI